MEVLIGGAPYHLARVEGDGGLVGYNLTGPNGMYGLMANPDTGLPVRCNCPDSAFRKRPEGCKHVREVTLWLDNIALENVA